MKALISTSMLIGIIVMCFYAPCILCHDDMAYESMLSDSDDIEYHEPIRHQRYHRRSRDDRKKLHDIPHHLSHHGWHDQSIDRNLEPTTTTTTTEIPSIPGIASSHRLRHIGSHPFDDMDHTEFRKFAEEKRRSRNQNKSILSDSNISGTGGKKHNGRNNDRLLSEHPHRHHKQQVFHHTNENNNEYYNVSVAMKQRLFDRDSSNNPIELSSTSKPVSYRNPYDILHVPLEERVTFPPYRRKTIRYSSHSDYEDLMNEMKKATERQSKILDEKIREKSSKPKWINKRPTKITLKSIKDRGRGRKDEIDSNADTQDLTEENYVDDYDYSEEDDDDNDNTLIEMNGIKKSSTDERNNKNVPKRRQDTTSDGFGRLTRHKYKTLGTQESVKQSRLNYLSNGQKERELKLLATSHAQRIDSEALCKWPKPKVVPVQTDPSKIYTPHCTILHRCGDDTGCCYTQTKICVPKSTEPIDLYFQVFTVGSKQAIIEKQTFVNHTECMCVNRATYTKSLSPEPLRRATVISCSCPKRFEKVLQDDGTCRCDCSSSNNSCDWMKKGKEHFPLDDRKCIIEGRCKSPTCEYGTYNRYAGRCPRKEDKIAVGLSFSTDQHLNRGHHRKHSSQF